MRRCYDNREIGSITRITVGDLVHYMNDALPGFANPILERHRLSENQLPSATAVVRAVHGDGVLTLQIGGRGDFKPGTLVLKNPARATGKIFEHVPMSGRLERRSGTWKELR